jgi:hypothetical protein
MNARLCGANCGDLDKPPPVIAIPGCLARVVDGDRDSIVAMIDRTEARDEC